MGTKHRAHRVVLTGRASSGFVGGRDFCPPVVGVNSGTPWRMGPTVQERLKRLQQLAAASST
eukprot:11368734-Alexandrium_andersonii.AAC.1